MESEGQFFLTLPSSASLDLHPNNTISDFTTELLNTIYLERECYEAGLAEILFDGGIENVPNREIAFVIYRSTALVKHILKTDVPKGSVTVGGIRYYQEVFYTKGGMYGSLSEVMSYFNIKFVESRICRDLVFETTQVKEKHAEIICLRSTLGSNLKSSLNVNFNNIKTFLIQPYSWFNKCVSATNNVPFSEDVHESSARKHLTYFRRFIPRFDEYISKVDFIRRIYFICDPQKLLISPGVAYIYTDIVEQQYLGDTKSSILRAVNFRENEKSISFPHVHYLNLSRNSISTIRIFTRDVEGMPYPFTEGNATFKLHIRKKNVH